MSTKCHVVHNGMFSAAFGQVVLPIHMLIKFDEPKDWQPGWQRMSAVTPALRKDNAHLYRPLARLLHLAFPAVFDQESMGSCACAGCTLRSVSVEFQIACHLS